MSGEILKSVGMWSVALPDGWQIIGAGVDDFTQNKYVRVLFPNGIVASMISGRHSYGGDEGLWEIAPCWHLGADRFTVMYSDEMRSICDWVDVRGYLDVKEIHEVLSELSEVDKTRVDILKDAFLKIRGIVAV